MEKVQQLTFLVHPVFLADMFRQVKAEFQVHLADS